MNLRKRADGMKSKPRTWHANYSRRIGYAEREGEAIIRKQMTKQKRKEVIGVSIAGGLAVAFFWVCYCLWVYGNTPIFK